MDKHIENVNMTYAKEAVNRVYCDGKIQALIIAEAGIYQGNGFKADLIGQYNSSGEVEHMAIKPLSALTKLCPVNFIGDKNEARIYINNRIYATANASKELIATDGKLLGKSEKQDALGLAVAIFLLRYNDAYNFYKLAPNAPANILPEDEGNAMFSTSNVSVNTQAQNELIAFEKKRKEEQYRQAYLARMAAEREAKEQRKKTANKVLLIILCIICLPMGIIGIALYAAIQMGKPKNKK